MPTEFDTLTTISDWSAKLAELLSASRAASEQSDEARLDVARRLTDFVAHSYPASPEIHRLDELASAAARALAEHVVADAVDRIASRTALLEILAGELEAIRSGTEADRPQSPASIAELASNLATLVQDARSLARIGSENPESGRDLHDGLTRLAGSLARLHAAFRSFSSQAAEPGARASGTVVPDESRTQQ